MKGHTWLLDTCFDGLFKVVPLLLDSDISGAGGPRPILDNGLAEGHGTVEP